MNYNSQLRGWGIDRALELAKINETKPSVKELTNVSNQLINYAYVAEEDLEDTLKRLFDLARNAKSNKVAFDAIIGTLERIQTDRIAQRIDDLDVKKESPKKKKEAVQ